jgi:hypothetical protein
MPDRTALRSHRVLAASICILALAVQIAPRGAAAARRASSDPKCTIVDRVDRDRLSGRVGDLSGANVIYLDGEPVRLRTRYALGGQMDTVQRYLVEAARSAGYEPSLQRFNLAVLLPDLTGVAASRGLDTVWTADTDGKVYRSTAADGWSAFARCGDIGNLVNDLVVDPLGRLWAACTLAGTGLGGLFVSTDGGATWSMRASGAGIFSLNSITFEDAQFGVAAGALATALHTADGGKTWDLSDPDQLYFQSFYGSATSGMFHDWIVSENGYVFETTNLGTSWDMRWLTLKRLWAIDFHGESTGVIVGDGITFHTRDGGATWDSVGVSAELKTVCMIDSLLVIAGGSGGEFMMSEDGGATWRSTFKGECSSGADIRHAAPAGRDRFWLAGRDAVRRMDVIAPDTVDCRLYAFADTVWGRNISFRREGRSEPTRRILLTAHYDSINRAGSPMECAPGADDNGSGVAAVLECARILHDATVEKSIEFVLFDGEEQGLYGSRYFASNLDPGLQYEQVVNLDMIGYEQHPDFTAALWTRSGSAGDSIIAARMQAAIDTCGVPLNAAVVHSMAGSSDQRAFWDVGIPGVLLIEGSQSSDRTPYYHSCGDAASTLNYEYLEVCTKAALATVLDLAGLAPAETVPRALVLSQNRPNPFVSSTLVSYEIPAPAPVDLAVYDVSGRLVAHLEHRWREPGVFERSWDGRNDAGRGCSSGIYFIRLRAGDREVVRKAVLVR